jgi:uncharacterized membrane protein YeaQ/YmgE (transglycosylase-associated protein family)
MTLTDLLLVMLVAIVCGSIAQLTSSFSRGGWIVNLGFAFFGAVAGVFVSRYFNFPELYNLKMGDVDFPIVYSILGAVPFLAAIGLFVKPGRR